MQMLLKILGVVLLLVAAGGAFIVLYGREATWELVGGPADQGAVDFAALTRGSKPNQYIVCPDGLCAAAAPDAIAPVFKGSAADLRTALRLVALGEGQTELVAQSDDPMQDRFVQRTPLMRWPDTISVRYIDLGDGTATLALYSRSQIGYSDRGVNGVRVNRWLAALPGRL